MLNTSAETHFPPFELLELLSDGEMHSGQELANLLNVSRTSVWKQLAKLKPLGFELQSTPGKGYRLSGGIELLSKAQIISGLEPLCLEQLSQLTLLKTIDSTNSYLLKQDAIEKITVCMAECQTAGRGRRGRLWISPFAKNIYLSFRLSFDSGVSVLEGLSLAIGVAIARALSGVGVSNSMLKWPNDVLWNDRKLAGVLIEVSGDPAGICHVVVGVGLNVKSDQIMNAEVGQPWVSLQEISEITQIQPIGRNKIASALMSEIIPVLAQYEQKGFLEYRPEWERLNAHAGHAVDVHIGSTVVSGKMLCVNAMGALVLYTDEGERVFHGGEVSLRRC